MITNISGKKHKFLDNFFNLMKPYRQSVFFLFVSIIVIEAIRLLGPYILKIIIDELLAFSYSKINYLIVLIALFFLTIVLVSIIDYFKDRKIFKLLIQAEYDLPLLCQKKLLNLDLRYHEQEGTGDKITKIEKGVYKFTDLLASIFWELLPVFFQFISTAIILFIVDYRFFLILIIFSILLMFLNITVNRRIYPIRKSRYKKYEEASGKMVQSIINVNTVQSFSQEEREVSELSNLKQEILKGEQTEWNYILKFANLREIIIGFGRSSFLLLGIFLVVKNQITIGTLVFIITLSEKVFSAISRAYRLYDRFAEGSEGVNRLATILEAESLIKNNGQIKLNNIEGSIKFQNVKFAYSEQDSQILSNLNLDIPAASFVALVGPSGGGKTTIVRLIFRHIDPGAGEILLDGTNIKDIELQNLRSFLSIVPQEVDIFNTSIFDNIAYANKEATMAEVEAAAKIANADEFINKLADKYYTVVGERGIKLSGGQRQRIGIARAILANPKILIFDEATSNLDTASEKYIQDAILKISRNKTIIVIAHRLSTIKMADKIIVIENGQVSEEGTHVNLLQQNKGLYRKLIELQSLGDVK